MPGARRVLLPIAAFFLSAALPRAQPTVVDIVQQLSRFCCTEMAVSDDGRLLATASQGRVSLWDLESGFEVRTLEPAVRTIANRPNEMSSGDDFGGLGFDPTGRYVASTAIDFGHPYTFGRPWRLAPPNVWDVRTGRDFSAVDWRYDAGRSGLVSPAFPFDPNAPALWPISKDPATVSKLAAYTSEAHAFSPDGQIAIVVSGPDAGPRDFIAVDVGSNRRLWTSRINERTNPVVTFSPDSQWMLVTGWTAPRVFDARTGKEAIVAGLANLKNVRDVAFSRDSTHLAAVGLYYAIVFSVGEWQQAGLSTFEISNGPDAVTFMPDGSHLVIGTGEGIVVREWRSGRDTRRIALRRAREFPAVAISRTGHWLGTGTARDVSLWEGEVILWDLSGVVPPKWVWNEDDGSIRSLAFSPDEQRIAAATLASDTGNRSVGMVQGNIAICSIPECTEPSTLLDRTKSANRRGEIVFPEAAGAEVAFTDDGSTIVAGVLGMSATTWPGISMHEFTTFPRLVSYDAVTLRQRRVAIAGGESFSALALSPDGRFVASGHDVYTTRLWSVATGRQQKFFVAPDGATRVTNRSSVNGVAFNPDGRTLATAGSAGELILWNVASGAHHRVADGREKDYGAVAFSPDGRLLIAGECEPWPGQLRASITAWDAATRARAWSVETTNTCVSRFAFGPRGNWFAAATNTGIAIRAASSGALLMTLATLASEDWLAWTPDGRYAGTPDGIAGLAAVRNGERAAPLATLGPPMRLADLFGSVLK